MKRRYVTLDVFSTTRFGGNPLAVVLDSEGLDDGRMQAIAREFNYSETTFVLPPKRRRNTAEVRIFTPVEELPFAGHPNVGTAFALARIGSMFGRPVGLEVAFEEKAGVVPVRILNAEGDISGAELTAPKRLKKGSTVPPEAVAACLGLKPGDIASKHHPPVVAGVGTAFILAEVKDVAALGRIQGNAAAFARHLPVGGTSKVLAYAHAGRGALQARMLFPVPDVREDPATGSANAALVALLAELDPAADKLLRLKIRQGVEMGRPSLLLGEAEKQGGRVGAVRVGGNCVPVMEGLIEA
jgi:trans-2,3-dihydro-3-hydroxyanthranilate isomerase